MKINNWTKVRPSLLPALLPSSVRTLKGATAIAPATAIRSDFSGSMTISATVSDVTLRVNAVPADTVLTNAVLTNAVPANTVPTNVVRVENLATKPGTFQGGTPPRGRQA